MDRVLTVLESPTKSSSTQAAEQSPRFTACPSSPIEPVQADPDGLLSTSEKATFISIEGVVNIGPVEPPPPQRKGHVLQYSRDQLVLLQTKFDQLEAQVVFH